MARFDPINRVAGSIANTIFEARPATFIKSGAVPGQQVLSLGGVTNLAAQPYTITYKQESSGNTWQVTGILYLTRRQQTLPLALAALMTHLNTYQDVQATISGTDLTLKSKDAGVTPTFAFLPSATLTLATSTVTNAVAPRIFAPGTVVGFSVDPNNGEKQIVQVGSADFSAINAGVVIQSLLPANRHRAENVTYDVMVRGTIWMQLYGTAPLVPATAQVQVGNFDSTTPGNIGVAGLTATKFTTVKLLGSDGVLSKFNILDKNVAVGDKFRLELE